MDKVAGRSGVVMGWLVEGTLDLELMSTALDRLLAKWPLLGGRLEYVRDSVCSESTFGFFTS